MVRHLASQSSWTAVCHTFACKQFCHYANTKGSASLLRDMSCILHSICLWHMFRIEPDLAGQKELQCLPNFKRNKILQQHPICSYCQSGTILCSLHRSRRAIEEATQRLSRAMDRADAQLDSRRGSRYAANGHHGRGDDEVHRLGRTAEHDFDRWAAALILTLHMLPDQIECIL